MKTQKRMTFVVLERDVANKCTNVLGNYTSVKKAIKTLEEELWHYTDDGSFKVDRVDGEWRMTEKGYRKPSFIYTIEGCMINKPIRN